MEVSATESERWWNLKIDWIFIAWARKIIVTDYLIYCYNVN